MASNKSILGYFAIALVTTVVLFVWFLNSNLFWIWKTRQWARAVPVVAATPQELRITAANPAKGVTVAYGPAEFEVPWSDVDNVRTRIAGNFGLVVFRSGKSILFSSVGPKYWVASTDHTA
jgi:hypothetical protein